MKSLILRFKPWLLTAMVLVFLPHCTSCSTHYVTREDVQHAHGIQLPASAREMQQIRAGGTFDYAIVSIFEIEPDALNQLLPQFTIKSRNPPAKLGPGDPRISGWNVWPQSAQTFVPGDDELEDFKRTWKAPATPVEMLSCASPKGDWLHVEIWSVSEGRLVKLCTVWH